ncbi:unnamed protein product [Bemisia tabaci]|uniref:Uncharacterized protein n=1 Tax=Bemisia tabaci TaxID=7038 RepID=A0A9P0F3F9_BEMTA|nr:unnamed protein product [Bemisia tabaci]
MIASVVVLSAFVAVASSQYYQYAYHPAAAWSSIPAHSPITGQPLDTPETTETNNKDKRQILTYSPLAYSTYSSYPYAALPYAALPYASSPFLFRKRRDVSTETEETKAPESNNQKRQIFTSAWGYPSAYAPVAYSAYPSALSYSAYPYASHIASPFLFRKRRDVSATEEDHSEAESDDDRKKRQLFLTGAYPYAAYPYSWPYRAYSAAPIAYYG